MAEDTKAPPGGSKPAGAPGSEPAKQAAPAPEGKAPAGGPGPASKTAAGAAPSKASEEKPTAGRAGDARAGASMSETSTSGVPMDAIRNIPVTLSVVLGTVNVPVASLMKMQRGEIISLSKKVAEPVEILANGRLIARGEIVVVEDGEPTFAITLTELVGAKPPDPAESAG